MIESERSHDPAKLSNEDLDHLMKLGWAERVGRARGVWVCVEQQMLYVIEHLRPVWQARCSTAESGTGAEEGSMKTPLGWHRVAERIGSGAPWGQVFRSRAATGEAWKPGDDVVEDLMLTRVIVLDGEEPGVNKGRNAAGVSVDSKERNIYIHGTNAEARIGTPASHGCIRLLNDDVIEAFDRIPEGTPVLISEHAARVN